MEAGVLPQQYLLLFHPRGRSRAFQVAHGLPNNLTERTIMQSALSSDWAMLSVILACKTKTVSKTNAKSVICLDYRQYFCSFLYSCLRSLCRSLVWPLHWPTQQFWRGTRSRGPIQSTKVRETSPRRGESYRQVPPEQHSPKTHAPQQTVLIGTDCEPFAMTLHYVELRSISCPVYNKPDQPGITDVTKRIMRDVTQ